MEADNSRWDITRAIPQCAAAGLSAINSEGYSSSLKIDKLQLALKENGVILNKMLLEES